MQIYKSGTAFFLLMYLFFLSSCIIEEAAAQLNSMAIITHGPILGRPGHNEMGVWVRTSKPSEFLVNYWTETGEGPGSISGTTHLKHDNTGTVQLNTLAPNTTYHYEVFVVGSHQSPIEGSFLTLPHADDFRHPKHNPDGLFNFSFEFACGNNQHPDQSAGYGLPAFKTMLDQLKGKIYFQILNGDWLYEDRRETSPGQWQRAIGITDSEIPRIIDIAPTITGVWENYKIYLSRSENLAKWHRHIPTVFTFDDHEILNDVWGAGSPGLRDRRAIFRDIGVQAWHDYLGWSNPLPPQTQRILFGKAELTKGSDVLIDQSADYSKLDLKQAGTLHVHWGGPTAGVNDNALDEIGGHPAAGVYKIVEVLDRNRLRIRPAPKADGHALSYSIGMYNHYRFRVSNCDFFVLDTRSNREMHDTKDPHKKGLSMLGTIQKAWLMDGMKRSDADFLFVVSSVNFTIPHVGGGKIRGTNKDDAWTVFMDESNQLIDFWNGLGKPVFVLTGDLHNSFVIKIADNVWEFASGPHNSQNHIYTDEGSRPPSGDFEYNGRKVNIRWSTFWLDDIDRKQLRHPHYCVVQINNVINNPRSPGEKRWVAYPQPQVVFQYYDGLTGELKYAEAIAGKSER